MTKVKQAQISCNLKEHVTKHENHSGSCEKCEMKAPSALFFNVSDGGDELAEAKDDNPDVTLACNDGKRGGA